jgi:hypothetical protein
MEFDNVQFHMLGLGGQADDMSLEEIVDLELQRIADMVCDPDRADKANIQIKIDITKSGENGVVFSGSVKVSEPPKATKSLSAFLSNGRCLTAQHKQQSLPGITPIKKGTN